MKKRNLFLGILSLFVVVLLAGCAEPEAEAGFVSPNLLDNVISNDGKRFEMEHFEWFTSREEVLEKRGLKDADVTLHADGDTMKVVEQVSFKMPKVDATVIYNFDDDQLVSGQYVIEAGSEDELVRIGAELKKLLEEFFPEPDGNSYAELEEEALRSGSSSGLMWIGEDESNFYLSIPEPKSEYLLTLSVHAPTNESE